MKKFLLLLLGYIPFCFALSETCNIAGFTTQSNSRSVILGIPARVQWEANYGYCGEVSLISAGLYYGQYVSQYDARILANKDFYSKNLQLVDAVLGYYGSRKPSNNMVNAAENMHFTYQQFNNSRPELQTSREFLLWVKKHIIALHPVIIGVYINSSIFGNNPDSAYDHIVPVFGLRSSNLIHEKPSKYYDNDIILFHDNYLYTGEGYSPKGCYQSGLKSFQKSRTQADSTQGTIYSLSNNQNHVGNFGLAITGVKAQGVELLPIQLFTQPVSESPAIKNHSNIRPLPEKIRLFIYVKKLKPNTDYILYKYTNFNHLPPHDDFSLSEGQPAKKCLIRITSGSQFVMHEIIYSNSMAIYRAMTLKDGEPVPEVCK